MQWIRKFSPRFFPFLVIFLFSMNHNSPVLFEKEMTLAAGGDGFATIASIGMMSHDFEKRGSKILIGDTWENKNTNFGRTTPSWFPTYWKLHYIGFSRLLKPADVWDFVAFMAMTLNGIAMYMLVFHLTSSRLIGLGAGLVTANLEFFVHRSSGHLMGLGTIYIPIFAAYSAVLAGSSLKLRHQALLGVMLALNISQSEYYGYFGGFFCVVLFLGYRLERIISTRTLALRFQLRDFLLISVSFSILLFLLYPNILLPKLALALGIPYPLQPGILTPPNHDEHAFQAYSVQSVLSTFEPKLSIWTRFIANPAFFNPFFEANYKIGFTALFSLVSLGFLVAIDWILGKGRNRFPRQMLVWCAAIFVVALFALKPDYPYSLVNFTKQHFPFFRVGSRALLYVDIGVIALLSCIIAYLLRRMSTKLVNWPQWKPVGILGYALALCIFVGIVKESPLGFTGKLQGYPIPHSPEYVELGKYPEGWLVELPLKVPGGDVPEANYDLAFAWLDHQKPLVNMMYGNPPFSSEMVEFCLYMNRLDSELGERLFAEKIEYVSLSKADAARIAILSKSPHYEPIVDGSIRTIFRAKLSDEGQRASNPDVPHAKL